MAKYSMGMGSPEKDPPKKPLFTPDPSVDYTRRPVNTGPEYTSSHGMFPFGGGQDRVMLGKATEFPAHSFEPGQGQHPSHFLGKGAGSASGMPNFGGDPNSGGGMGGGHLHQAGTTFNRGADKFDKAVNRLVNAVGGGGGAGIGGQGGFNYSMGMGNPIGAGAPRNQNFGGGDPLGMIQQAGLINQPSAPGSAGYASLTAGIGSPFQASFAGAAGGARRRNTFMNGPIGQALRAQGGFIGNVANVLTDLSANREDDFDHVLGNDPFTQLYNYSGGFDRAVDDMLAGLPGLNLTAGVATGIGNVINSIRNRLPGVPTSNEAAKTIGIFGHFASMGAAQNVTQYLAMKPHTGQLEAGRAASVLESGEMAANFEFGGFRTMGLMGLDMSVFGMDPYSYQKGTMDPNLNQGLGNLSASVKLSSILNAGAEYLGLGPTSVIGQYSDALAAQGFKTSFVTPYGGSSISSPVAGLISGSTPRGGMYPTRGNPSGGRMGNAIGFSMRELIEAQYSGFTPTQVGLAFSAQGAGSNLGLIGAFGGRSILQQAVYHNLAGAGADRYIQSILQMGRNYTELGYEFGRGQYTKGVPFTSYADDMMSTDPFGNNADRIEYEIAALQDSGYSNFAQENSFGAFTRMDMKMGKSTDRFGANLFAGIKDKVIFSQLVARYGLKGAMEKAGTQTPGEEAKMLQGIFGKGSPIPYYLTRGAQMTHEETDVVLNDMADPLTAGIGRSALHNIEDGGQGQFKARHAKAKQGLQRLQTFYTGTTSEVGADGEQRTVFQAFQDLTGINTEIKNHLDRGIKVEGLPELVRSFQNLSTYMEGVLNNMGKSTTLSGPVNKMKTTITSGPNAAHPTGTTQPVTPLPPLGPTPF